MFECSLSQENAISAAELPGERECEAPVLLRGADLPGHGHQQQQTDAKPNLQLDQRTVRILQTRGPVMDGELTFFLLFLFFSSINLSIWSFSVAKRLLS